MKLKTGRHTSALKELRKNQKRQKANKAKKSRIKTEVRKFETALSEKNTAKAKELLKNICSLLYKAAKNNVIHKNKASNIIAKLSKRLAKIQK